MKKITRRDFSLGVGAAAGAWMLSRSPLARGEETASLVKEATGVIEPAAPKATIAVAEGRDPAALARAAIDALGGIDRFVKKGQKVVVKPNIAWDKLPQMAANTNPQFVGEVVRLCMEAGAEQVLVFDRTCNDARRSYNSSGIAKAARDQGARTIYIREDDSQFENVAIPDGKLLKEWPFIREALQADVYINLPIAKHHGLTELTLSMKNIMGAVGGRRGTLHVGIGEKLADLHRALKPTLTVMDAYRVLLRNGPTGGNPADTELKFQAIAGVDFVAVDAYTTTLFGLKPKEIPFIAAGEAAGLGTADLNRIEIRKAAA